MTRDQIIAAIELQDAIKRGTQTGKPKQYSAWDKGVTVYALELLEDLQDGEPITRETLLNGVQDWNQYSWGGCSLIYDCDIAERLCTPSELKRTKGGELNPNSREQWLDVQARALGQAASRITRMARKEAEQ